MQQIYTKTPMPKCGFNKVALQPMKGFFWRVYMTVTVKVFWSRKIFLLSFLCAFTKASIVLLLYFVIIPIQEAVTHFNIHNVWCELGNKNRGSKLLNGCLVVWPIGDLSNLYLRRIHTTIFVIQNQYFWSVI